MQNSRVSNVPTDKLFWRTNYKVLWRAKHINSFSWYPANIQNILYARITHHVYNTVSLCSNFFLIDYFFLQFSFTFHSKLASSIEYGNVPCRLNTEHKLNALPGIVSRDENDHSGKVFINNMNKHFHAWKIMEKNVSNFYNASVHEWNKQDNLMDSQVKSIAKYLSLNWTKSLKEF